MVYGKSADRVCRTFWPRKIHKKPTTKLKIRALTPSSSAHSGLRIHTVGDGLCLGLCSINQAGQYGWFLRSSNR